MSKVRQQIVIDASSRAVWSALTTVEGLSAWWGRAERCEPREGGRIALVEGEGDESVERRGSFHAVKPTRVIELRWDDVGSADDRGTRVQFQIGRHDNETKLHVVQSGARLIETEGLTDLVDARWKAALLRLRDHLEG